MSAPAAVALVPDYSLGWALPFAGLLLTMGVAPLLAPRLWHAHYRKLALVWGLAFVLPDAAVFGAHGAAARLVATAVAEFLPFILLLGALFVIAGGLRITGAPRGTPAVNTVLLAIGTALASLVGTIGAAMLMLRPVLRANRERVQPTHVLVFFIFLVANIGGALTPLGNPPLLLGYLKGVPFGWPAVHLALPTLVLVIALLGTFYVLDRVLHRRRGFEPAAVSEIEKLGIEGVINLPLLALAIGAVMLRSLWSPTAHLTLLGVPWDVEAMVSAGILLVAAGLSLRLTPQRVRAANSFAWGPLIEVAALFAAIFVTLIPLSAMMNTGAAGPFGPLLHQMMAQGRPDDALFYRATGLLSALLDNAPTYLMFFGLAGNDATVLTGPHASTLAAITAGAAYFGGLTYIGNSPNLMVKAIAESQGLPMPGFFGYVGWAAVLLLPWLLVVEALFFH